PPGNTLILLDGRGYIYLYDAATGMHVFSDPASAATLVTVQTTPAGRAFSVDGANYSAAQTFTWTPGSTHTIATTTPQSGDPGVRYYFSSWSDGGAVSHTVAPTSKSTTYTAKFGTQYYLTMSAGTGGHV